MRNHRQWRGTRRRARLRFVSPREAPELLMAVLGAVDEHAAYEAIRRLVRSASTPTARAGAVAAVRRLRDHGWLDQGEALFLFHELFGMERDYWSSRHAEWSKELAKQLRWRGETELARLAGECPGGLDDLFDAGGFSLMTFRSRPLEWSIVPEAPLVSAYREAIGAFGDARSDDERYILWRKLVWWRDRDDVASGVVAAQQARASHEITAGQAAAFIDLFLETGLREALQHERAWKAVRNLDRLLHDEAEDGDYFAVVGRRRRHDEPTIHDFEEGEYWNVHAWALLRPVYRRLRKRAQVMKAGWLEEVGEVQAAMLLRRYAGTFSYDPQQMAWKIWDVLRRRT